MKTAKTIEDFEKNHKIFTRDIYCGNFCPDEWIPLVDNLCSLIKNHMQHAKDPLDYLQIVQIKEKFGGLRFYYDYAGTSTNVTGYIRGVVDLAERLSFHIK